MIEIWREFQKLPKVARCSRGVPRFHCLLFEYLSSVRPLLEVIYETLRIDLGKDRTAWRETGPRIVLLVHVPGGTENVTVALIAN